MFDQLLVFLARHAHRIPERLVRAIFLCAAEFAWVFHVGSVRQLERNLTHVLAWSHAQESSQSTNVDDAHVAQHEVRALSRQGMRTYFAYFAEAMTVGARTQEELLARVRAAGPGVDSIIAQTQQGSAPIAMGHQGNWDYDGFWAQFAAAPVTTVAEKLANPELLQTFVDIREQLGMTILLTGTPHLTERLEQALRKPRVLVPLLADRDLSKHGEFVHAFGSMIRVARGPAALAYDTGLPLYVVNTMSERLQGERRRNAHSSHGYQCYVTGPIDIDAFRDLPREQAIHAISQAWVDVWAQGIARAPQDWHMLQPIFLEDLDMSRLHDVPDEVRMRIQHKA